MKNTTPNTEPPKDMQPKPLSDSIRKCVVNNTLGALKPDERVEYYEFVCAEAGLRSSTRPFEFIELNGKLQLYARKEAGDQLRALHDISTEILSKDVEGGTYVVHIRAKTAKGRVEDDLGAANLMEPEWIGKGDNRRKNPRIGELLRGEERANAMMKATTKAKRRVTLSISGLGIMDESEVETLLEIEESKPLTPEKVKEIADKVKKLREQAAGMPKSDKAEKDALIREAVKLEAQILDYEGSGHTPEPPKAAAATPTPTPPKEPAKEPEKPKSKPVAAPAPEPDQEDEGGETEVEEEEGEKTPDEIIEAAMKLVNVDEVSHYVFQAIASAAWRDKSIGHFKLEDLRRAKTGWIDKNKEAISQDPKKTQDAAHLLVAIAAFESLQE